MKNSSFQEIWKALHGKRVAMTLHLSPDGDSLASCTAMKCALERYNECKVTVVSADPVDRILSELPLAKDVEFGKDISRLNEQDYDVYLFLDTATQQRVSRMSGDYHLPTKPVINIDHHHTNECYGSLNYVDASKPSACSVLLDMFASLNVPLDPELSTRLLLGICTDSGFFAYSASALKEAAYLIDNGADYMGEIVAKVRMRTPLSIRRYQALIVSKLQPKGIYAYSTITKSDIASLGLIPTEARMGISSIQDLEEFEFVFLLVEYNDIIKGSFRSRTNIDVSKFATALGGGGHKAAAAFVMENVRLDEALSKTLAAIEKTGINRY